MAEVLAFSTKQIIDTHMNALRARAITSVRCITTGGLLYINDPTAVRYDENNPDAPFGEARFAHTDNWLPITELCIDNWARLEGLNWRKSDGTVSICNMDDLMNGLDATFKDETSSDYPDLYGDEIDTAILTPVDDAGTVPVIEINVPVTPTPFQYGLLIRHMVDMQCEIEMRGATVKISATVDPALLNNPDFLRGVGDVLPVWLKARDVGAAVVSAHMEADEFDFDDFMKGGDVQDVS